MISLIVATVNRVAEFDRLLCSLEEQSYRDFEVILVDQNPDDRLVPVLRRHARLATQHLRSERGLSRARNAGLRAAKGDILASYDKSHLVPFGEFVPLRSVLPINKITPGTIDFSAGPGPRTIALAGVPPFSPLICYEAIFPGAAVDENDRPDWLLNITNDAWYGYTSGPFQHFAIARTRAVEEGLPLVRNGNNGISGVVDPYGRIVRKFALDGVGVLDAPLPAKLPPTLYAQIGDWGFAGLLLALLAFAAAPRLPRGQRRSAA